VSRGYIGVALRDVDSELERSLNLPVSRGAMVQDVTAGSPADRAGVRGYDVVVGIDEQKVLNDDQLIREIAGRTPGTPVRLTIVRDGHEQIATVKLAERPPRETAESRDAQQPAERTKPDQDAMLGLSVRDLDRQTTERLDLPKEARGVLITRVEPLSSAFDSGIERGTVLLELNRQRVATASDYRRLARAARPGDVITLWVYSPDLVQRQLKTLRVEDR
jgi:serine protease Do